MENKNITCSKFRCDEDLAKYTDSMLFSSGPDPIASGTFVCEGKSVKYDLVVAGAVRVRYNGAIYTTIEDFPIELKELIRNNPNNWAYVDGYDVDVDNNNYFEFIEYDGKKETSVVYEADLSEKKPEDIRRFMESCANTYFDWCFRQGCYGSGSKPCLDGTCNGCDKAVAV